MCVEPQQKYKYCIIAYKNARNRPLLPKFWASQNRGP